MHAFADLFYRLDGTTRTGEKVAALAEYFRAAPDADRLWTVALLSGRRPKRLITTKASLARQLLCAGDLPHSETEILVVALDPHHTLRQVCLHLLALEVNIKYAYALITGPQGGNTIAIHTDDQVLAGQLLRRKMFTLLGELDLAAQIGDSDPMDPSSN